MLTVALGLDLAAAIIHGVVIERATQRPLARSQVRLEVPVPGGGLRTVATATVNRSGNYWFPSLADGAYLVTATRAGYLPGRYGQTRPTGPGLFVAVKGDEAAFAELRLARLGAITGRIVDENHVGLADVTVVAYPARLPLRIEGSGRSDDRGVFRIARLRPGRYWVRTAAIELEDQSGLLPTFFPLSNGTQDARMVKVEADRDETDVDIQPLPGRLFTVTGTLQRCPPDAGSGKVSLVSDTGTKELVVGCETGFEFRGLAPNNYELHAEPVNSTHNWASFSEHFLDRTAQVNAAMTPFPRVRVQVSGVGTEGKFPVSVRRKSLAGGAPPRSLWDAIGPGYWEVLLTPPAGSYLASVSAGMGRMRANRLSPADVAPEIRLEPESYVSIDVRLAGNAAMVEGTVKQGVNFSISTPVYLYPVDADVRRRMYGYRTMLTGPKGEFKFDGVAPGQYLILSTWDLDEIDEAALTGAGARSLTLGQGQRETADLTLWER